MTKRFISPLEEMADLDRKGITYTVSFTTTEGDIATMVPVVGYGNGWLKIQEADSDTPAWINMTHIIWLNVIQGG